jgi:hypothetical protein
LDNLLSQLKRVDPALYHDVLDSIVKPGDYRNEYIIQGKLQEAIQARDWLLEQSTFTARTSAKIWKKTDPVWKDYIAAGDTPTHALLAAYLAAIDFKG